MARGGILIQKTLFDILTVISLVGGQAEQPFLEDGIVSVPEPQGQAQALAGIADPAQAVFVPAIGTGAGMLVAEICPGLAFGAVIFTNRASGPFT